MVRTHALSSYQASWPDHERRAVQDTRPAARPSAWRKALVGVLLASAAGVYAYRQFAAPVYDPGEGSAEPEAAAVPERPIGPSGIYRIPTVPAEVPVAAVPLPQAVPLVPREVAEPVPVRSKFDEVFGIERPVAVPVVADVAAADISGESTIELSASIETGLVAESVAPQVVEAAVPPAEVLAEAEASLASEVAPVLAEQAVEPGAVDAGPGEGLQAAVEVPLELEELAEANSEKIAAALADPAPEIEAPVELAAVDLASPEPPILRAQRVIPRRADSAPVAAPAAPAPLPPAPPAQAESASPAASYVQQFPLVVLNGQPLGAITVREFAGERQQIHLGALLSLFKLRMSAAEYERLISSASADQFVDLDALQSLGLEARYDVRRGRLIVGSQGRR